ncbi:hypothetical protein B9Z19DRAFT_1077199 [Tuber borchii]|uniref:Uncharacterized protein n=1 Tax=Tuber borchii TaxID=42251 RepID=A0A2T7A108_TUBBO|nr:hypothetical protein B9Z19DRAFT_1077199 [Tuber borchii]
MACQRGPPCETKIFAIVFGVSSVCCKVICSEVQDTAPSLCGAFIWLKRLIF